MFSSLSLENMAAFQQLEWKQHSRINILIGENDTGKTYLLKMLYVIARSIEEYTKRQGKAPSESWQEILAKKLLWTFQTPHWELGTLISKGQQQLKVEADFYNENIHFAFGDKTTTKISEAGELNGQFPEINTLFIAPKEILTAFDAIAATREQLEIAGFDDTYFDLIKALRLPTTKGEIHADLQAVANELDKMIEGQIQFEQQTFIFKRGDEQYTMPQTAEGIKKMGIFSTLIRNRKLKKGTVLLVDEPELNLHPKTIVALVDLLFQMANVGIQIYLATHSYFVLRRFEWLARKHNESISLCSLFHPDKNGVITKFYNLRDGMPSNPIIDVSIKLYEQNVILDFEQ